jgi:hypothetical protein
MIVSYINQIGYGLLVLRPEGRQQIGINVGEGRILYCRDLMERSDLLNVTDLPLSLILSGTNDDSSFFRILFISGCLHSN